MTFSWETPAATQPRFSWENRPSAFHAESDGFHLPTTDEIGAFGSGAADAITLGFGDEAEGAIAGVGAALTGHDYGEAYRRRVQEARDRLERARSEHPIYTGAGSLAGAAATLVVPGLGETAAGRLGLSGVANGARFLGAAMRGERLVPWANSIGRMAAGGGPGAVIAQGLRGASTGALWGGAYGFGAGDGDLAERGQNALATAGMGAALGAVSPFAFQGFGHAGRWYSPFVRGAVGYGLGALAGTMTGQNPGDTGLIGAGLGVFGRPVATRVGGPILAAVRRAWSDPVQAFGRSPNAVLPGGPPISGGGGSAASSAAAGGDLPVDPNAVRRMTDALHRQSTPVEQIESLRAASAAENAADVAAGRSPIVRRLADVGPELSAEMDTLANMPGMSYTRVREIQRELASNLPRDLRSEMRGILGVRNTPGELIDELRAQAANASDGYNQVTTRPPVRDIVENRIIPLMNTPEMQPVLARRFRVEEGEANLAQSVGENAPSRSVERLPDGSYRLKADVSGRRLHDLKVNIDDELNAAVDRRSLSPAGRGEQHMLDGYREAYLNALDEALPGYRSVRAQRGSVYDAERALRLDKDGNSTVGARILKMDPEEITRFMRNVTTPTGRTRLTTPFERRAYQSAVVQEVLQKIDDYVSASSDKVRNAGEVLDRVGLQNRLRAVFSDRPEEINQFLNRAIERAEQLRRAGGWTGNSASARRLLRAGDQFTDAMTNAGGQVATGNPLGAIGTLARGGYNAIIGGAMERQNNAYGNALLMRLNDDPETIALLNAIRKLQAARLERARQAGIGGQQAVLGTGSLRDQDRGY